ncbi:MAG: YchJ family metal-binding protein [Polaribacter sp.]|nr:YchJ family metal-binding protein [Polaribacter sp.]
MKCPCNPTKKYNDCCKKAHQNIHAVTTAEMLMRSRYSAFVLANIDYLQKSHFSKTRPSTLENQETLKWTLSVKWVKLDVLHATENTVEFKAYFYENGTLHMIHENSSFVKENNHWVYKAAL